jgi:SEC-C motif-containing protein
MKSRYSAYAMNRAEYIVSTTHPDFREIDRAKWIKEIREFSKEEFQNLKIIDYDWDEITGFVEFEALVGGTVLHEKSRFVKENGRWYYTQGEVDVHQ